MEALPLATVKAKLSEVVDRVERQQDRVTITRNGRPVAVIVGVDDLEGLEETLEILSDRRLVKKIQDGIAAARRDDVIPLDELEARLARR
jgi:prevent-host-death family protein